MRGRLESVIDVAVCVPSTGLWPQPFGKSLAMQFASFMRWRPEGVQSLNLRLMTQQTSMLVLSRHELVKRALKAGCSHVLFLDADMQFPDDTLQRLLMWSEDAVAANCTTRTFPVVPVAHDTRGKVIDSRGKHGLQKTQHVGLAVALFKTEVFKRMTPPLFMMEWIPELQSYCGEDVYFSQKLKEAGIEVKVDHELSLEVKHVGQHAFGWSDVAEGVAADS